MPHDADATAFVPEFSRPVQLSRLNRSGVHQFDEVATEAERARVAALLELLFLAKFRLKGTLEAVDGDGWRFKGSMGATVTQPCVVSLQPVKTRLDVPVVRTFLPTSAEAEAMAEIEIDADALEEIDPMPDVLDLGLLAMEELALALPPYPRAEGAEDTPLAAAPPGSKPLDAPQKPFAALAALKDKLPNSGD